MIKCLIQNSCGQDKDICCHECTEGDKRCACDMDPESCGYTATDTEKLMKKYAAILKTYCRDFLADNCRKCPFFKYGESCQLRKLPAHWEVED